MTYITVKKEEDQAIHDVLQELERAQIAYPEFNSKHEAYGVLSEEVYEVLKALHENDGAAYYLEVSQVAAVCLKEMIRLSNYGK